jgi:beta-glucosidase
MGTALTRGIQKHNVMATVKHFALNSMENARFKVDVRVDDRALYEVSLPQFRKVIDAGCKTVMSAYNKVNGTYCGQNHRLLTDVLRTEWGFDGFVHSDWVLGVSALEGAVAGLDIENPEPAWFGAPLRQAVASGDIAESVIGRAVTRILRTQLATLEAKDPQPAYPESLVACGAHRALAREAAEKSAVLLTNRQCLPLDASAVGRLGMFGTLATLENTGDQGSSRVSAPYVVTPYEGIARYLGRERVVLGGDERDPEAAARVAAGLDAAVVVVGYTAADEGEFIPDDIDLGQTALPQSLQNVINQNAERRSGLELGGDRRILGLHADQVALVEAVARAVPKTIVVVVAGSAVLMADWCEKPAAVMQTFYAGMEGGSALARLLFGDVSPSGKLPFSVARHASHYPPFDIDATRINYDLWHGYRLLDRAGHAPLFPFGFGLSYSRFEYDQLVAWHEDEGELRASVTVHNVGDVRAAEAVQLYLSPPGKAAPRPEKSLCGFERVELDAGDSATVQFSVPLEDVAWFDATMKCWRVEEGTHALFVGGSSHAAQANAAYIHLNARFL